jgi:hypothetical protein
MNIDKALAQLADPEVSAKKKRKLMDRLKDDTTQEQQRPLMGSLVGAVGGGLAGLAGGVGGRKLLQKKMASDPQAGDFMGYGLEGLKLPYAPKSLTRAVDELSDDISSSASNSRMNKDAAADAATALGGGAAGAYVGQWTPALLGGLTNEETRGQPAGFQEALERVRQGTASAMDKARLKKYHEGASNAGGGIVPFLGSALAGAALGIPTLYFGGPAAGRLARKHNLPIGKTPAGRELTGELGFDAIAGTALGGAGAGVAHNALSDYYDEPF